MSGPAFRAGQPVRLNLLLDRGQKRTRLGVVELMLPDGRYSVRVPGDHGVFRFAAHADELETIRPGVLPAPQRVTVPEPLPQGYRTVGPRESRFVRWLDVAIAALIGAALVVGYVEFGLSEQGQGARPPANASGVQR